jgi:hypothetical protein
MARLAQQGGARECKIPGQEIPRRIDLLQIGNALFSIELWTLRIFDRGNSFAECLEPGRLHFSEPAALKIYLSS